MIQCSQDWDLLQEYLQRGSEQAFSMLVARHVDMVFSSACRQVRDRSLAEEVTQIVFIVLARKAKSIAPGTVLAAWLQKTTRYTSLNVLKTEARRRNREKKAAELAGENMRVDSSWKWLSPMLDDGLARLAERDRAAIMLRFFEQKSCAEIGQDLGISENAASMRISRAVDRLRQFFERRGVTLSSAALGGVMAANTMRAAPFGLATNISRNALAALKGTAINSAAALAAANAVARMMAFAQAKLVAAVVVITLAIGVSVGMFTDYIILPLWEHSAQSMPDMRSTSMNISLHDYHNVL